MTWILLRPVDGLPALLLGVRKPISYEVCESMVESYLEGARQGRPIVLDAFDEVLQVVDGQWVSLA